VFIRVFALEKGVLPVEEIFEQAAEIRKKIVARGLPPGQDIDD